MSICLGPFDHNPTGIKMKVKMRDFNDPQIFHSNEALKNEQSVEQLIIFENKAKKFYVLIMLNYPEIVVSEDICIMISTEKRAKIKNYKPIKFRYWLNAKWVKQRAGLNTHSTQVPID